MANVRRRLAAGLRCGALFASGFHGTGEMISGVAASA